MYVLNAQKKKDESAWNHGNNGNLNDYIERGNFIEDKVQVL